MTWWRDAVIYQIYPRSFADSNGDGIGDLCGIVGRLDHLAWLGVDAIWLTPIMPSPNADWGYDVSDYVDVHPDLGSLDDFDLLVREAGERGIRILNDLVPNHTSNQHAWFRDPSRRDWYVWADPKPDGSPPNNWMSHFGGSAWAFDEASGQYYLHLFLPEQPDLNWWNPAVADAFDDILRFWFDRGVAGFRIDVCHAIVKDRELRDNPPATEDDPPAVQVFGQRHVYSSNRPEVHDVLRRWRRVARSYRPERVLLGETYVWDLETLASYYGRQDDELQLAFNIPFVHARLEKGAMSSIVEAVEERFPPHAWPCWTGSNHDAGRLASRWCGGDHRKIRCSLMLLLTLRGTPVLYYGDEIGLTNVDLTREQLLDPVGRRFYPAYPGRDPARTPMPWESGPGAGFTVPGAEPWLPIGDPGAANVAEQRDDPRSILHLCRRLIELRRAEADLRGAPYQRVQTPGPVWAYRRGRFCVVLNLGDAAERAGVGGRIEVSTSCEREGQEVSELELGPWEGAVLSS